jgi:Fe2+ or Zn2+ uptake regulation protein
MLHAMAMSTSETPDVVVMALLDYLARHPQAADTLAGVARWWVGDDSRYSLEQVRHALDRLVDGGALRRERLADGTDWYAGASGGGRADRILH